MGADEIAARVKLTLAQSAPASHVVADAWALAVAPEEEYVESEVVLESLEFAASAVSGLAAGARAPADGGPRASSTVTLPLADSAGGSGVARKTVTLYGPGDVVGLDAAQVIRRYPRPGAPDVEETVLAHVELDRPELPWAFSAQAPGDRMRPWLALVVVPAAEVQREAAASTRLPVLRIPSDELPDLADAHLWAHAQASRNTADAAKPLPVRLSAAHAPVNLARIVSTRVLTEDTRYVAALVPTTSAGVAAGLGLTGGTTGPAWGPGTPDPVRLPAYDLWEFTTGPDGDFKDLALRLRGVVAPYEVGRRFVDTSRPGEPLDPLPAGAPGIEQVLRCALFSPTPPPPERAAAEDATWDAAQTAALRAELDRPAQVEGALPSPDAVPDLPVVGPRLYGKLHRGVRSVTGTQGADWYPDLNLEPRHRVVGGLGTRVVQRDQEQLMQSAWAQLGEVERANRAIALAQLAELAGQRLHRRVQALELGRLVQLVAPVAPRVRLVAGATVAGQVRLSATPVAATTGAFRQVTRFGAPIVRRADDATRRRAGGLVGVATARDFTRAYRNPDGVGGLSADAVGKLDLRAAGAVLGIAPGDVAARLRDGAAVLDGGTLAGHLTHADRWHGAAAGFDPAVVLAERWSAQALRPGRSTALDDVRAQRVGPLLAELSVSRAGAASPLAGVLQDRAVALNNTLLDLLAPVVGPVRPGPVRPGPVRPGPVRPGPVVRPDPVRPGPVVRGVRPPVERLVVRPDLDGEARRRRVVLDTAVGRAVIDPAALRPIPVDATRDVIRGALAELAATAATPVAPVLDAVAGVSVAQVRDHLDLVVDAGSLARIAPVPRRDPLAVTGAQLVAALDPHVTVRKALDGRLVLSPALADRWARTPFIAPIMAAPRFDRPMYRALVDYDRDWLVPGLGLLPDQDFVTVLSTNSEFMEAFLVGLSDELAHELLWRGYPTDRRGTYFHRFWNPNVDELRAPVHAFTRAPLGSHVAAGGSASTEGRAVVVLRSALVHRFPDLIIQVLRDQARPGERGPVFEAADRPQVAATVLFAEHLDPDLSFVGVDLSVAELDTEGWWIVVAEHPSATRFDLADAGRDARGFLASRPANAAAFATHHLHRPTRVAFEARDLVER
ncbi:hypothetical protein [Isoptericola sp. QY 916]|uniref:hypothetical protein n=1 Tax=Isoptericola sp. QY 916 TaxID=2782570 RepID=UPI003D2FD531|nr:hypothetical protein [Isoptericola sp. QY 916]